MKLYVHVILDSGGRVTIEGHNLTAEDVNEVFGVLAGRTIESAPDKTKTENQNDQPPATR